MGDKRGKCEGSGICLAQRSCSEPGCQDQSHCHTFNIQTSSYAENLGTNTVMISLAMYLSFWADGLTSMSSCLILSFAGHFDLFTRHLIELNRAFMGHSLCSLALDMAHALAQGIIDEWRMRVTFLPCVWIRRNISSYSPTMTISSKEKAHKIQINEQTWMFGCYCQDLLWSRFTATLASSHNATIWLPVPGQEVTKWGQPLGHLKVGCFFIISLEYFIGNSWFESWCLIYCQPVL